MIIIYIWIAFMILNEILSSIVLKDSSIFRLLRALELSNDRVWKLYILLLIIFQPLVTSMIINEYIENNK